MSWKLIDRLNHPWPVKLTGKEVRLLSRSGYELGEFTKDKKRWTELCENPWDVMDIFRILLDEAIEAKKEELEITSDEDWFGRFGSTEIEEGLAIFREILLDFSPAHKRGALKHVWAKFDKANEMTSEKMITKVDELPIEAMIDKELDQGFQRVVKEVQRGSST